MARPVGSKNTKANELKNAVIASFDRVGGIAYLEEQARANPTAYMALIGKIMPREVEMEIKRSLLEEVVDEQDSAHPANQE